MGDNVKKWWDGYPWRLIQTNLREIDMEDIDADAYVRELKSFKATVVMINTSGIIASYPTKLPYQYQSQYLKGGSLEKIIAACHGAGIKVLARTDFSKVRYPLYQKHPEWAYRDLQGNIVNYEGDVHCCVNGEYQRKYMYGIVRETLETLDVDGIFFNMGGYQISDYSNNYHGFCQCGNCARLFGEYSGMELPKKDTDASYTAYSLFRQETMAKYNRELIEFIQTINPELAICCVSEKPDGYIRQESNTALDRALPHWQYDATASTKWAVANYPHMLASTNSVDFIDIPVRHVSVSPAQQGLRLAQVLAAGGRLDYYLIGRLDNHEDKTGYTYIKDMYHYHAANEDSYRSLKSVADVALFNTFLGRGARRRNSGGEFRGWYRFLAETHRPFDVVLSERAGSIGIDRYKTLILPDLDTISDSAAALIDKFVDDGGVLVASGSTGWTDDSYKPRAQNALKSLGIERKHLYGNVRSAYFQVDNDDIAKSMAPCSLIYADGDYIYSGYDENVKGFMPMRPPQPFGPPERCYTKNTSDWPCYTMNGYGKGKAFYMPWYPGSIYLRQGYVNTLNFVDAFLSNAAGAAQIGGNLSPMVETSLMEDASGSFALLHLVNGSGHFGTSFFDPVRMYGLNIVLPKYGKLPASVVSLVTGASLKHSLDGSGGLVIELPELGLFDAIKIIY
ncbi:MAG: beta-galactosidase trimerization domain-containing protein [Oscillospiraceae bacterium]|nr:beta-galactosidase trimerization domain-containing protein [Oscillospiraceae bacterium]